MSNINKIETLRAIGWSADQMTSIVNLSSIDTFSQTDKLMLEQFKRIYEQGETQFDTFCNLLDSKGSELDEYSVIYYTTQLKNSPFSIKAKAKTSTYWQKAPDSMAQNSNEDGLQYPLDANICGTRRIVYNKLPRVMQQNEKKFSSTINTLSAITASQLNIIDNTMPCLVKGNANRYIDESTGGTNTLPHALYNTNDVESAVVKKNTSTDVRNSAKTYLGAEDYRLHQFRLNTNPFQSNSKTEKQKVEREISYRTITYNTDGNEVYATNTAVVITDCAGNSFETDEARQATVTIPGKDKDVTIKLHTVDGQLGSNVLPQ